LTHKKDTLLVNEFQKVLLDDKDLFKNMFTMNKVRTTTANAMAVIGDR
jgi:hypothetical protein